LAEEPGPEVVNDTSDIKWHVSGAIKRRIGAAIVACSQLEHTLEIAIWAFLKLDSEDGKMLTARMEATRRQTVLKELITRYPKEGFSLNPDFWEILQTVIETRNKVAHGIWVTAKGRPAVASTKWRGFKNFMALEIFPYERIEALENLALSGDEMIRIYLQDIGLPHIGFAELPERASPIRPPDHPTPHPQSGPPHPPRSSQE
jgi:hypothetical protein